jgi:hypothetical protein
MAIDIKQLVIKSNVEDGCCGNSAENDEENSNSQGVKLQQEVLSECRRMIIEMLNDKGRR